MDTRINHERGSLKPAKVANHKLNLGRVHTQAGHPPLEGIRYERRGAKISNPDGSVIFEASDAEVPADWSQLASDILISRYFRRTGVPGHLGSETSARQVVSRIARAIRAYGERESYFADTAAAAAFAASTASTEDAGSASAGGPAGWAGAVGAARGASAGRS